MPYPARTSVAGSQLWLLLLLTLWLGSSLYAQQNQAATSLPGVSDPAPAAAPLLVLEHFVTQDAVFLRWRAREASTWARLRPSGYRLERRELTASATEADWQPLTPAPIREDGLAEWQALIDRDSLAGVTGAMLYEDGQKTDYLSTDGSRAATLLQAESLNNAYLYLLMGTDLSFAAARAAGLAFRDDTAQAGTLYQYRVRAADNDISATSRILTVRAGAATSLPPVTDLRVSFGDRVARLEWSSPPFRYPSFDVYRATSPSGPWQRVNRQRMQGGTVIRQTLSFTDSLADNTTTYYYSLQPFTPWGVHPERSASVGGSGLAAKDLATPYVTATETEAGDVAVSWTLDRDGDSTQIAAFYVYRSYENGGGRLRVAGPLPADRRSVRDTIFRDRQFYVVQSVDARGRAQESATAPFLASDTLAPPPPTNIVGECDLDGRVTLAWDHSAADDVIGYRVFYSTAADRPGTRITDTLDVLNFRRDSLDLRSLGDTVYYRVVALDERENVSDFSSPYPLVLPDINPPTPPRLRFFTADTAGVSFSWAPSSSSDVVGYRFERRARGTAYWAAFATLPPTTAVSTFRDATGRDDIDYEYRLLALDEVGLRGVSNVLVARRLPPAVYPAVSNLRGEALPAESRIELRWNYPSDSGIDAFKIFRSRPGESLTTYRTLEAASVDRREARRAGRPAQWRFSDVDLRRNEEYVYAVQPIYRSGSLGRLGTTVTVVY